MDQNKPNQSAISPRWMRRFVKAGVMAIFLLLCGRPLFEMFSGIAYVIANHQVPNTSVFDTFFHILTTFSTAFGLIVGAVISCLLPTNKKLSRCISMLISVAVTCVSAKVVGAVLQWLLRMILSWVASVAIQLLLIFAFIAAFSTGVFPLLAILANLFSRRDIESKILVHGVLTQAFDDETTMMAIDRIDEIERNRRE